MTHPYPLGVFSFLVPLAALVLFALCARWLWRTFHPRVPRYRTLLFSAAFLLGLFLTYRFAFQQNIMRAPPLHHETIAQKSALTLHPKPAFFEWVAAVAPQHPLGWGVQRLLDARETIAWIIPSCGTFASGAALEAYLDSFKPSLLASELRATFPTETLWPELSVASFDAFFELHLHPHVASIKHLSPTPPIKQPLSQ